MKRSTVLFAVLAIAVALVAVASRSSPRSRRPRRKPELGAGLLLAGAAAPSTSTKLLEAIEKSTRPSRSSRRSTTSA
jgi:hypothetical protein